MVDREALLRLVQAWPPDTAVSIPRAWLLELLSGAETTAAGPSPIEVDLTAAEAGRALHRSDVTVRAYCATGVLKGAYRFRHRQWRIPRAALEAFQAAERKAHERNGAPR
jgi:hypothetical protein